ncbi:hypothetical protein RvY_01725-1 [Ramazzottius varieornatus]|uniref:EF-hand domain-containing protein n=1 Tax=Ramazzottius varieornatus TaxID=947166 RepID=A0A1D1UKR4_RAMVA|nr:hypothetical protein RvY_01725-1 [Ramazzottius varieornatus]
MDVSQSEIHEAFILFDTKGDGKIAAAQLGDVLRALGQNPTEADVNKFGFAKKHDERISVETFVPILHEVAKVRSTYRPEEFIEGFRHFDKDQSGNINSAELRHMLTTLGERLSDDEFEQVVGGMEDGQGMINYEAFVRHVMNG